MKIAIIGSGISGLTAAYLLNRNHDITVFESRARLGGHTATRQVQVQGQDYAVDTGFIVYNDWTYPGFIKLMTELGIGPAQIAAWTPDQPPSPARNPLVSLALRPAPA